MLRNRENWTMLALVAAAALCLAAPAVAQPTYSITFDGPTIGLLDSFGGVPITEGDVLTPAGPPPGIVIPVGAAGLGVAPTPGGFVEVDALSYGLENFGAPQGLHQWYFSVDEFAVGAPGVPAPSVTTVGAAAATEASADYFLTNSAPGPLGPGAPPAVNAGAGDGDGLPITYGPALGLIEPNGPSPLLLPDPGDNLDALDVDQPPGFPVFFSLDAAFIDPLEGGAANTGTAVANGFVGGDVLVQPGGGAPGLYAGAPLLGLDADGAAPDTDDVDALILGENGVAGYQPVTGPYSWNTAGTDMLLYSVRRGSAIIGLVDVIAGAPIEEGDILIPVFDPIDGVPMFDGIEGDWDPGIFVAAEVLGLATVRSGTAAAWGVINPVYGFDAWADDVNGCDYFFIC